MKRFLVFVIALALLTAALSGCAGSQGPTNGANSSMFMTIAETLPSGPAFEYREPGQPYCFYAYDLEGKFYRVLWDMPWEGLHEKDLIRVAYTGEIREIDEWKLDGGYTPQYEITATCVWQEREVLAACLTHEGDSYTLTLPQSGETLELTEEQARFLPYITDDLVAAAEKKIAQEVAGYDNHSGFYLQINEGYLCLVCEVIHHTEAPDGSDHEHLFYAERISSQAVTGESNSESTPAKSSVLYRSDEDETCAFSSLLWAKYDNGDGTYTETQAAGIKGVLPAEDELAVLNLPKLLSFQNDTIQAIVPVNGQVLGVYLLDMTDRVNDPMTETTWEEIEMLPAGRYYIVTQVLLSGNCDPDALQHSFCYEDLFCLVVEEPTHPAFINLPSEMPDDFAIKFSSSYLAEEFYDTYTGTIQKDLIENGTVSANFIPSEEILKEIYAKVLEYQICAIDRKMTNDVLADENGLQYGVTPNFNYEITITANENTYMIRGDDTASGYTNTDTEAKNFMDFVSFMRKTVYDTPEYQNLPDAVGGYE